MNLVFLQLKRDLRAGRGLLALWAGLLILYVLTAVSALGPTGLPADPPDRLGPLAGLLSAAWWIAGFLAAWWVLRDPPADANAFWRARPLGWAHLVAAKLILILGGLVLPLTLAHGMVLVALGAGNWWSACLIDAVQTQWWWIFGFVALAALGGSWRRMLSIALGGWVAGAGAFVVLDGLSRMGVGLNQHALGQFVLAAEATLYSGWIPVVAGAVLMAQYAFRRPARIASMALALVAGGMLLVTRTPAPRPELQDPPEFSASIRNNQQLWQRGHGYPGDDAPDDNVTREVTGILAILDVTDPPAPYFVHPPQLIGGRVRYPDRIIPVTGHVRWYEPDPEVLRTYQSAVPGMTILNLNPTSMPEQPFVTLVDFADMNVVVVEKSLFGGQTAIRHGPRPRDFAGREGLFEGDLRFHVGRHDPVVELPLAPGASWEDGPNQITVSVGDDSDSWTSVNIRIRWVKLEQDKSIEPVSFLLVNRERGEAYIPLASHVSPLRYQRIYPFCIQDLWARYWRRDGDTTRAIDDDWLAGATVLVVTRPIVGQVTKSLRLEGFRLWPEPGELADVE